MKVYVIKRTTTLVSNNAILGTPNSIFKIFEDKDFAERYFNKYLAEEKIYSASKKVFWTHTPVEEMELSESEIEELQKNDPYIQIYRKYNQ